MYINCLLFTNNTSGLVVVKWIGEFGHFGAGKNNTT
jgi:hypothetical protein